jgi:hypothetical protein
MRNDAQPGHRSVRHAGPALPLNRRAAGPQPAGATALAPQRCKQPPHLVTAWMAFCVLLTATPVSFSQNPASPAAAAVAPAASLAPFGMTGSSALNPAWRLFGLPGNKTKPLSRFELVALAGEPALQVTTDKSYGLLAHAWQGPTPGQLEWRWRVERPLVNTDIATKGGDDAALKVCVLFDQPVSDIPLLQRASLALARAKTGQDLPKATLCYVWDSLYPSGTSGANPYSARVRYIVLDGLGAPSGQWVTQRRHVAEDFQRLFGMESPVTPPVIAVVVGADSDNTQGQSVAYVSQLRWLP